MKPNDTALLVISSACHGHKGKRVYNKAAARVNSPYINVCTVCAIMILGQRIRLKQDNKYLKDDVSGVARALTLCARVSPDSEVDRMSGSALS